MSKVALYVPGYCLVHDKLQLTDMCYRACAETAKIVSTLDVACILSSSCYHYWREEAEFKAAAFRENGVPLSLVRNVPNVTSTYDEATAAANAMSTLGVKTLILVCDEWHAPRAVAAFKRRLPSNVVVLAHSFRTDRFERSREPSRLKSWRIRWRWSWATWNLVFWIYPPR